MSEDDLQAFRISEVEKRIEAQEERLQKTDEQISSIKTDIAQMSAYVKQIYDDIHGSRTTRQYEKAGKIWSGVIAELIRALIIISGIIAGIKLVA